jgi:hypothetical protein
MTFGLQSHNLSIKLQKTFLNDKNSFIFVPLVNIYDRNKCHLLTIPN